MEISCSASIINNNIPGKPQKKGRPTCQNDIWVPSSHAWVSEVTKSALTKNTLSPTPQSCWDACRHELVFETDSLSWSGAQLQKEVLLQKNTIAALLTTISELGKTSMYGCWGCSSCFCVVSFGLRTHTHTKQVHAKTPPHKLIRRKHKRAYSDFLWTKQAS